MLTLQRFIEGLGGKCQARRQPGEAEAKPNGRMPSEATAGKAKPGEATVGKPKPSEATVEKPKAEQGQAKQQP